MDTAVREESPPSGGATKQALLGRPDLDLIASLVPQGARVLDIGCGDGKLLGYLARNKGADARGIEISQAGVNVCVARGLSVIQGDADADLGGYPDGAFDVAILSDTIQATRFPDRVVTNMVRIGKQAIVSLPNFGYWRLRLKFALSGRMPATEALPHRWYNTPNIHLCTLADFEALCGDIGVRVERVYALNRRKDAKAREVKAGSGLSNLLAEEAVFLLSR